MNALLRSLRPHQWSKNLLLAVPAISAQVWMNDGVPRALLIGFVAFSLAASGGYLLNDLIDIRADRDHPAKRHRPFASGQLSRVWALAGGPLLMISAMVLAFGAVGRSFGAVLVTYVVLTTLYSLVLKRQLLLDVIVLAGLYALRLLAGGAAADVVVSSWLLAFSMFFFLSIAFAKRLVELESTTTESSSRAYLGVDRDAIRAVGPACGLLSILVLALYINSAAVLSVYGEPRVLWLLCPLLLYWILRLWFLAIRGELHHDPVVFALRDKVSYAVAAGTIPVLYLASQ